MIYLILFVFTTLIAAAIGYYFRKETEFDLVSIRGDNHSHFQALYKRLDALDESAASMTRQLESANIVINSQIDDISSLKNLKDVQVDRLTDLETLQEHLADEVFSVKTAIQALGQRKSPIKKKATKTSKRK